MESGASTGKAPEKGWACVQNGRVVVSDPDAGMPAPVLIPCEGIDVQVNGRSAKGPVSVSSRDQITLVPRRVEPKVSITIAVEEGGMEAYVTVRAEDGTQWQIVDVPPSGYLNLRADAHKIPAEVNPEDIRKLLSEKGVVFGVDDAAVVKAAREKSGEPVLVAKGQPPAPGRDGQLEFLVPIERRFDLPADSLRVDFRDTVKIPMVKKGQVTAVKRKPVPGKPGRNVFGKDVLPPKPDDPKLRPGKGVILQDEGDVLKVVATLDGYPTYSPGSGLYEVDEVYRVNGDVNLASGNIKFVGTVEISGNVTDGMKVHAEGGVRIRGTVTGAEVRAWRNVEIGGNVFQSVVVAGRDTSDIKKWDDSVRAVEARLLAVAELVPGADLSVLLEGAEESPEDASGATEREGRREEVSAPTGGAGATESARLGLLDRLRALLMALGALEKLDISKAPAQVKEARARIREVLVDNRTDLAVRLKKVASCVSQVRSWVESEMSGGQADVLLPYCQNCSIESARDIIITGQGAFYSTLTAGRAIKATGSPGVIRGGEARATDRIEVKVAGGQGATPTVLRVSEKGRIVADEVYPNTILVVGRFRARTENLQKRVRARIVDDRLVIDTAGGSVEVDSD